jgi:hypothetical protein
MMLGTCTVPPGRRGPWSVEEFEISAEEASLENVRAAINGRRQDRLNPGRYKRLMHERRGVVMSNTPMEVSTHRFGFYVARGRVLVTGLGLGMFVEAIAAKDRVTSILVVEIDPDVIALVGPHFADNPRIQIVQGDAYTWKPDKGDRFDFAWHDIWDEICADNNPDMAKLARRYAHWVDQQGFWGKGQSRWR